MSFKTDFPNILPDFVTPRNFLLFIISREYVEFSTNARCFNELMDEETKFNFYLFLFKSIKDVSIDLFKFIKENENPFKKKLNSLVIKKIEILINNLNDLVSYVDILDLVNNVLSSTHERNDVIGSEGKGKICKYSVIGIFLKKFSLSFQALPMEKMVLFIDGFRQVAESSDLIPRQNSDNCRLSDSSEKIRNVSLSLKKERLSEDQVRWSLENMYNEVENVLYEPDSQGDKVSKMRHKLSQYKKMYPELPESFFLDSLLTMHNKDFEMVEKDVQLQYPAKLLVQDDGGLKEHPTQQDANKDNKKGMIRKGLEFRQKLSEVSLNNVTMFSSMGFKNEALLHYRDAIFNAKLSRNRDLMAEVGSVGNSIMPINDNPNGTIYSLIETTMNDKTALGNIRDFMLQGLHNNRSNLAELLHKYFCSPAPQRREITSICLIYLSIIFRSYGFESMSNTYLQVAACLESLRRTKNHEEVLVEVFSQLISSYSQTGRFDKAFNLYKSLRSLGNGVLCSNNQLQVSMLQTSFSHALMRLDFSKAYRCLEKLQQVSLAEYGLRKVQILFMEDNNGSAIRLGNHIISFAIKKRELLVYNHVSISQGWATISSQIPNHKSSGIVDNFGEMRFSKDLPSLDDASSQNWGSRDWATYECRCRWLMCTQLINRQQLKTAKIHLDVLQALSTKFYFYQFQRLSQVLQLAITNRELESQGQLLKCPLKATINTERYYTMLSSKLGLSTRNHMLFVNLLVNLYVGQLDLCRDAHVEKHLAELADYCEKCGDWMGQAHCWQMIYCYNAAVGNDDKKAQALFELELLLENRLTNVPNLDFLSHVL